MNPRAKNHPSVSTKTLNVQAGNMAFAGPKKNIEFSNCDGKNK